MARSTYKTYLMHKATTSATEYTKLIDIKSFPDLGGTPERLDATTLSDPMRVYIEGIQDTEELTFEANYSLADFKKIQALAGQVLPFAVFLGDEGADGKFGWNGTISVKITGGAVNEVVGMTITCTPNTVITEVSK